MKTFNTFAGRADLRADAHKVAVMQALRVSGVTE